jgi:hypothetical protein
MKPCPRCKQEKPSEAFYRNKRKWDGLSSACKDCMKMGCMRFGNFTCKHCGMDQTAQYVGQKYCDRLCFRAFYANEEPD